MVLEKTLESGSRRSNQSILKEISPEYSLERLMLEAETPILWPPDAKNWLIRKDSDAGKGWRQEAKGTTEDGMVGWRYRLDGHSFEQSLGVGDGQGGLVCCSLWVKESDTTEWLNYYYLEKEKKTSARLYGIQNEKKRFSLSANYDIMS